MLALQANRESCRTYNVTEPDSLVAAENIMKNRISSIPRGIDLTDQFDEVKKTCGTHEKTYETKISLLMDIAVQRIL